MRALRILVCVILTIGVPAAMAEPGPLDRPNPLGELQSQVDSLVERIETLENSLPSPSVEGRTYCEMATITMLRGFENTATELVETGVSQRLATFSGGTFNSTVVSAGSNGQNGAGVVVNVPDIGGQDIGGTYTQTGRRLHIDLSIGRSEVWYVSADGSVIYNNSIHFFGPFRNSLTFGFVRSTTFVESASCEGA
jgi:hypothetical protein